MHEETLKKLQFSHVSEVLAELCACSLGQALARALKPSADHLAVRHLLDQVRELLDLEPDFRLPPLGGVFNIRQEVQATGTPGAVDGEGMSRIQLTLAALSYLRSWLVALPEEAVKFKALSERVHDFSALANQIDQTIDSRGKVRDDASERLSSLRRLISELNHKVRGVFDRVLSQRRYQKMLQYGSMTFHDDRFVLPLKAEHRGRIPGIVHRSSKSGSTVFVEPAEAVEINNAIIRLRLKEDAEVTRILNALARDVHRHAGEILQTLEVVGEVDLIAAKVRFAKRYQAHCPQINDRGVLDLHGARHPVLLEMLHEEGADERAPRSVVPIDVRVGDDFDLLVITGPNTGGKTVALKTIGLFAAMTQAGIPIPAEGGTTVPVYSNIFIDVGDEQSIEQSLSTFSGHLSNILGTLKQADRHSLVLFDELGAGTDPEEGAALGRAIMDELLAIGCSAVVTTHLSVLKAAAYCTDRVDNASVEFDVETLQPTYHVRIGEPGNSNALTVAERLGMPHRLLDQARTHLSDRDRILNRAIEGTLQSRRKAEQARKSAVQAAQEAQRSREQMQRQTQELEQARTDFRAWQQWVSDLNPGDLVYVKRLAKNAKVVRMRLHKQSAVVCKGAVDYEVSITELAPSHADDD